MFLLEMILIRINKKNRSPIFQQIIDEIIKLIDTEIITPGYRLPSTRELGMRLGVDRSTVYKAYQYLLALGYLESKPGSYTTVRKRTRIVTHQPEEKTTLVAWGKNLSHGGNEIFNYFLKYTEKRSFPHSKDFIDFTQLSIDERLYPIEDLKRCMNSVLVNQGGDILGYGDPYGFLPLREYIANRLQTHGISVSTENILITNGCQQALELLLRLLITKEKGVIIESPTYINLIPLLRFYNADVTIVPMLNDGMDLDYLERKLKKGNYSFIYTIPNFHNPTGITTSQPHRERLLSLAEQYKVPIIEDGFEEEMKYFGKVVLPIKSMDKHQIVIYLGTFSKVLFAGMRIGWIAGDKELIRRLAAVKKFSDLGVNTIAQAAINNFCREGYYDLHIKRIQRVFRKRMLFAMEVMKKEFPKNVSWTKPEGGYLIWVSIDESNIDKETFMKTILKNNITVSWGDQFYYSTIKANHFRLSIAKLNEEEIKEGIIRLGKALRELNSLTHQRNK